VAAGSRQAEAMKLTREAALRLQVNGRTAKEFTSWCAGNLNDPTVDPPLPEEVERG
jgi:hypothetical protein